MVVEWMQLAGLACVVVAAFLLWGAVGLGAAGLGLVALGEVMDR